MSNYFVKRDSGQTIRVEKVTEHYASIVVVRELISTFMMPVAEYDTTFVLKYLPLDIGKMQVPEGFRPPANADHWERERAEGARSQAEAVAEATARSDEAEEGVRIGDDVRDGEVPTTVDEAYAMVSRLRRP